MKQRFKKSFDCVSEDRIILVQLFQLISWVHQRISNLSTFIEIIFRLIQFSDTNFVIGASLNQRKVLNIDDHSNSEIFIHPERDEGLMGSDYAHYFKNYDLYIIIQRHEVHKILFHICYGIFEDEDPLMRGMELF